MRVKLTFQPNESLPPDLLGQVQKSVIRALDAYGLNVSLEVDRESELEAYARFWAWHAATRGQSQAEPDEWPKLPRVLSDE